MTPVIALGTNWGIKGALGYSKRSGTPVSPDWWLAGGIDAANCIAAYQAKGAASYAASLVNLANAGTYDLTSDNAPAWAADTGWTFGSGTGRYLYAGFSMTTTNLTIATRSILVDDAGRLWTSSSNALRQTTTSFINVGAASESKSGTHIFILAGLELYKDGVKTDTISASGTYTFGSFYIGNKDSASTEVVNGSIQAAAFYNTTLTGAQITALNNAMAAL